MQSAISIGMFATYFPVTMRLAAKYRPFTLFVWTGFYYFGLHNRVMQPFATQMFQQKLNDSAASLKTRYGIKTDFDYIQRGSNIQNPEFTY